MTRDEVKKTLAVIKSFYPSWKIEDPALAVEAWTMMLEDYDYNQIQYAVKRYTLTDKSGFAPSIGQLIGELREANPVKTMSEGEAWGMVQRAIRNSAYNAKEEFDRLPKLVQRAVGSYEVLNAWAMTDIENTSYIQSNFLRVFSELSKREEIDNALPPSMRIVLQEERKMLDG